MRLKNRKFETFNDGTLVVCEVSGRALIGTKISGIRFGDKTVGVSRFWDAKVLGNTISRMICIPPISVIERNDVVLIEDKQYQIVQIQEKIDTFPPCLYLSLESVTAPFRDERAM